MFSLKTFCGLICREKHIQYYVSYKLNRITKLCRGVAGSSGTSQSSCELSSQSLRGCSCDEANSKMMLDPTRTWWMLGISNYIIDMKYGLMEIVDWYFFLRIFLQANKQRNASSSLEIGYSIRATWALGQINNSPFHTWNYKVAPLDR